MEMQIQKTSVSKASLWTGWIISALLTLFLLMDGVMKLVKPGPVLKATLQLGFPESKISGIGVVLLACTALYVIGPTAVLGAILLTGYLGGAVASQVRIGADLFSNSFPIIFGALIWLALLLRDSRLRMLLPLRR